METETIEGEVVEQVGHALELVEAPPPATLFKSDDPVEVVAKATQLADVLKRVLVDKKLTVKIGKGEHVLVEGWTLLGSMLGVFPVVEWTRKVSNPDGWEARVVAKTLSGVVVGAAEAECLRSEKEWGPNPSRGRERDDFMLRSMAQTRATSKALRQPLGFVVSLAGFQATPAEEMPRDAGDGSAYTEGEYQRVERNTVKAPKSWKALGEMLANYDEATFEAWSAFSHQAQAVLFGADASTKEERDTFWPIVVSATMTIYDESPPSDFPPPTRDEMRAAWSAAMEMDDELEGPPWAMSPDENETRPLRGVTSDEGEQ